MAVQDMNNRYVAIGKEDSYGTTSSSSYFYGEVDDETIKHTYDLLTREDMSRYGSSKSVTGKEYMEGDINMALINDNFTGMLLLGLMGTDTVTGSGAPYSHTFTEAGTGHSLEMAVAREEKIHYYKGVVVESLGINAAINEYATVSASFMGKSEDSQGALSGLTAAFPDTKPALYFSDAKVFFNGDTTATDAVKSISFDITLNRDGDAACGLGSPTYVRAPPAQRREISGTIEFNRILFTGAGASNPTYTALVSADGLEFSGSGVELKCQFGDESTADLVTFNFYKIRFEAPDANVSGRDSQTFSVPFVALYDSVDNKMMDIVVKNDRAAAYSA